MHDNWVKINGEYIPQTLLSVKGIKGVRIVYDDDSVPFSFHAMLDENHELGYYIPSIGFDVYPIKREWGKESTINSDWIPFSY